ncbi:MAG: hypothetical protein K8R58_05760, partial [Bacteroidales bacterium]|nr:hypothetical protein [Bacteroidales bacterium]
SGGKGFFVTGLIFYTVSLFGAIQMWKLKKIGFHLYTVAQILLLILPVTYIKSYDFSYIELLLTGAFIIAYSTNLKYMS